MDDVIKFGSMRNFHPLLGSERYRKAPYAGWELAKEICTPEEVLSIFNAYLTRAFRNRQGIPLLSGATWEEVELSARTPGEIYESMMFPELPEFFLMLAKKTGKTVEIWNHSMSDGAGVFYSISVTHYRPDGTYETTDRSPE